MVFRRFIILDAPLKRLFYMVNLEQGYMAAMDTFLSLIPGHIRSECYRGNELDDLLGLFPYITAPLDVQVRQYIRACLACGIQAADFTNEPYETMSMKEISKKVALRDGVNELQKWVQEVDDDPQISFKVKTRLFAGLLLRIPHMEWQDISSALLPLSL